MNDRETNTQKLVTNILCENATRFSQSNYQMEFSVHITSSRPYSHEPAMESCAGEIIPVKIDDQGLIYPKAKLCNQPTHKLCVIDGLLTCHNAKPTTSDISARCIHVRVYDTLLVSNAINGLVGSMYILSGVRQSGYIVDSLIHHSTDGLTSDLLSARDANRGYIVDSLIHHSTDGLTSDLLSARDANRFIL